MLQLYFLKRTSPRVLSRIRCFNTYNVEYMPYANEQSASGTTHETVRHGVAHDKTVKPSDELSKEKKESQHNGQNDTLEWSAANSDMSHQTSEEESLGQLEGSDSPPSFYNNKSKPEPPRKGLFEPLKKPGYKNMEEEEDQPQLAQKEQQQ
ncbi:hypothetical protein BX666DRAFT_2119823 [Dichotomocladium elegans]|nr:hypothetical protein BX666DRAFT_2119823 [Dichotomocladium elegans]